jgi:NADPH-dependent glutamate synthase beta subunit-like oxidoreductase
MAGFGGVAEYGITVRWDKNFLKIIRLLLERRRQFAMFGGVRFGGTLTIDEAFADGLRPHRAVRRRRRPTVLEIPNGFARGMRAASDFLMALQLTGAAKRDSIANLQIRLPVVVIGGGLTAIDTATESLAVLRRAGGEVPLALRAARAGPVLERRGAPDRAGIHRACQSAAHRPPEERSAC